MKIKKLKDTVDYSLCIGCGACEYYFGSEKVSMVNIRKRGYRPIFKTGDDFTEGFSFCPAVRQVTNVNLKGKQKELSELIGNYQEIWIGHAVDSDIRQAGSSGGIISALSLFCIEQEKMDYVLHSAKDEKIPWGNKTVTSTSKEQLLKASGSRYAPSMPCGSLSKLTSAKEKIVFVGKPCDTSAVSALAKIDPLVKEKIGLTIGFFCAGTPADEGIFSMANEKGLDPKGIVEVVFRGKGWPGYFLMKDKNGNEYSTTYEDSWSYLQRFRDFCCHMCADGLGELADISCGDAWHLYEGGGQSENPGLSIIIVRTDRGREILNRAIVAGYITARVGTPEEVVSAQGLITRKQQVFGRRIAKKILGLPVVELKGFQLFKAWHSVSFYEKMKSIIGTVRRLIIKGIVGKRSIQ